MRRYTTSYGEFKKKEKEISQGLIRPIFSTGKKRIKPQMKI